VIRMKVYEMMAKRGIKTRRGLAKAAGIHETNMGKIVDGEIKAIRLETIDGLCRALDCQPGELFEYISDGEAA
jgi:putative transcriptional regulator